MNTNKAIQYLSGYVDIVIEGYYIEKFINICNNEHIELWNIKRENAIKLHTSVEIKNFKLLRNICKKTKCKVKIEKKSGLPFVIKKYKKRKVFIIILLIIIMGIITLSNFIWNIEVKGNTRISKIEILEELSKNGLKIGTYKGKINANSVINKIRLDREDIAWIGIDIEGTNAIVEIKETSKAPEIINENEYCNIISNKEGMITKINVQNGTAVVKEGDIVKEGDTLVLGYLEGKYTGIRYVHAKADIEAKIWYSKKEKVFLKQQIQVPTGATEEKYTLNINNFKINFYKTLSKFENYDTINENKKLKLLSNFYLPIEIIKKTNYEYKYEEKIYTEEELAKLTEEKIEKDLDEKVSQKENIINKQTNIYPNEDYIEVEVIYEVLENIGSEDKIIF